jgi:hypothetical protein
MPRVPWHLFQDRQPRAHLVVGAAEQAEGPVVGDELKAFHSLLTRLVAKQEPVGDYAATVVRDAGRPQVHFAFEDQAVARHFAAAVKDVQLECALARPSRIAVRRFSRREARGARGFAAAPRTRPRQGQIDQSALARHVSRGPRTPVRHDD